MTYDKGVVSLYLTGDFSLEATVFVHDFYCKKINEDNKDVVFSRVKIMRENDKKIPENKEEFIYSYLSEKIYPYLVSWDKWCFVEK